MDLELVQSVFSTLRISPPPRLVLIEASSLRSTHVPPYPPDCPALLTGVDSSELARLVRAVLLAAYPGEHEIQVIGPRGVRTGALEALMEQSDADAPGSVFVPPLAIGAGFETLAEVVAHLRAPDGCPWDREQTHASLRKHLLEESYEALAAIDAGDFDSMREEFGDLLLQVLLQTQIASESGRFNMAAVVRGIHDKLVRRHPHVFGDLKLDGVEGVLANWEKLKEQERGAKTAPGGLLDGVPAALPALSQAQEYQDRAARVGFDWPEIEGVLDKVAEEVEEIRAAADPAQLAAEIGDLLFALVNLARWRQIDAESALRAANLRFRRRFGHIETSARSRGRALTDLSLEEFDALWEEGKRREGH
jgi:tetrapyrrole methylase family protein/MazG family protein